MRFNKIISTFLVGVLVVGTLTFSTAAETVENLSEEILSETVNTTVPTNIVSNVSGTQLVLTWDDIDEAESYIIKYSTDNEIWKTVTSDTNYVSLENLSRGIYYYKISAKISDKNTAYSEIMSVQIGMDKLPAPANVKSTATSDTITITWDSVENAKTYAIKYSSDKKEWTTVHTTKNTVELISLKPATKYYYQVAGKESLDTETEAGEFSKLAVRTTKKASNATLNPSKLSIKVGKSSTLKVTGNVNKVKWSSSNKSIATVNSKGLLKV